MSGLNNLKVRLKHRGGARQIDRMIDDKKNSLNKALLYSYQSATAILSDGREFRCLINPNKISMELDDKMLSIPFEDICLNKERPDGETTTNGRESIGVKCGDVIEWKENGTHWIIYSQFLQEIAYFRGLMRQCENDPLLINGKKYWYYLKGPDEKSIDWVKSKHLIFNDLNYTLEIYISKTTETIEFFQRFKKCTIHEKPFEVQAVDNLTTDGLLVVYLKETHSNKWEEAPEQISDVPVEPQVPETKSEEAQTFSLRRTSISAPLTITGPAEVYPYDIKTYEISYSAGGQWLLSNKRAKIIKSDDTSVTIEIVTGKSGSVTLIYRIGDQDLTYNIKILSL